MAAILAVVDVVLEEHLLHLEEGLPGEEAVAPRLVLRPDPLHLQHVGHLLEAALQVLATLHQIFYVVNVGEVNL